MNEVTELALSFIAEGLSVIPLLPRSKKPALSGWKEYQEHVADEQTIRGWFEDTRRNIGIVCGLVSGGLTVIDFDDPEKAKAWVEQYGAAIDGCPIVQTGRENSGSHIYFRATSPVPCGKNDLFDLKGEGGYVVGPGSTHPSGRRYKLLRGDLAQIPSLDPALLGLQPPAVNGNGLGKAKGWQDQVLAEDVPEGQRHNTMVELVGRNIAKGNCRMEVDAFARGVNERWSNPLPSEEVQQIIDSVFATHERNHGQPKVEQTSKKRKKLIVMSIKDIMQAPPVLWLIDGILFDRTFSILGGYTGFGKSLLVLAMARSIADGFPMFEMNNYCVRRQGPVLIVD